MAGIVGRPLAAHQAGAAIEHIIGIGHGCGAPSIAHIDGAQVIAPTEHPIHTGHLGRVETAQVKDRQISTIHKHITHFGDLAGVQVFIHTRDGLKILHATEPTESGRREGIGERGIKDHLGHIGIDAVSVPTGTVVARVHVVGRARAAAAVVVVVERQRRVRRRVVGIGLDSSGAEGTHHGRPEGDKSKEYSFLFHIDSVLWLISAANLVKNPIKRKKNNFSLRCQC